MSSNKNSLPKDFNSSKSVSPSSIEAYNKYGVAPSNLRYAISNHFIFPDSLKDCLTNYFILEWTSNKFLGELHNGTIPAIANKGDTVPTEFQVIYHKTDPIQLRVCSYVKLSFRIADPVFNLVPTVLVKEIR